MAPLLHASQKIPRPLRRLCGCATAFCAAPRTSSSLHQSGLMLNSTLARCAAIALLAPSLVHAQAAGGANAPAAPPPPPTIASKTAGFERRDGFIPLYIDSRQGRLYAELPRGTSRALFWVSLASGFGSNPVGLDRGASGDDQIVRFDRDGD